MKSVKRTAAKALLVLCACALIIFLLLPFLETAAPADAKNGKKATPQIFTSNPLTTLVNRIAALFGNQRAKERLAYAKTLTDQQANEQFGTVQDEVAYSAKNAGPDNYLGTEAAGQRYNYGEAAMQNEEGDWVLVRQTLPSGASKGMHEVNATDDAYDRYVRQERTAKFTPTRARYKREVPDSKLAKFFRPIKEFFGFSDEAAKPVSGGLNVIDGEGTVIASSSGLGGGSRSGGSNFAGGMALDAGSASGASTDFSGSNSDTPTLADLIDPQSSAEAALEALERDAKGELSREELSKLRRQGREIIRENFNQAREKLIGQLAQDAEGQEPENLFPRTITCSGKSLSSLYSRSDICSIPQTPQAVEQQQKRVEEQNKKALEQLAQTAGKSVQEMPKIRMLVILGKTKDLLPPATDKTELSPLVQEFYDFMLEQKGCKKGDCYWVANEIQSSDKDLRHSVIASGANFLGDPLKEYPAMFKKFSDKKYDDLQNDNSEEASEFLTSLPRVLSENAPQYIPYTKDELDQLNERNSREGLKKRPQDSFLTYIPTAANTEEIIAAFPHPGFVLYDKEGNTLDKANNIDVAQRGDLIRESIADRIKVAKQMGNNIREELSRMGLESVMQKRSANIQQETQKLKEDFSKSNQLGNARRGQ